MKKYSLYLLVAAFALVSNVAFTSCDDDDVLNANEVLAVKSVLPTKIIEGQVVTITGTGLDKATAVVFPGDVTVTDISRVGNGYITVVTPAGVSAEGGTVTVEAEGESASSVMTVSLGNPEPVRVAPVDKEVKINECVEVYGSDLEFITRAYFPGADGGEVVVNSENFKRKSTGALYIYSPMGVAAGPAAIVIEDCSGKKYTLPEITLSDKVLGGGASGPQGEDWYPIWEGEATITAWESTLYVKGAELNPEGYAITPGMKMRLVFDVIGESSHVWACDGWWGNFDLDGAGGNNAYPVKGETEIVFPVTENFISCMAGDGDAMIIGADGGGIVLKSIEIFRGYPAIWSGEQFSGWWWYLPSADLDLSGVTLEAGQIIRFTFTPHDNPQTFCVCDGWWGAPFIREGGSDPNNVAIQPDEGFIEFEVTEGMAATMSGQAENALIIGGEVTITKIQIKTF